MSRSPVAPGGATRSLRFLPPVAIGVYTLGMLLILLIAGSTLGYDYRAYVDAARRILDGRPLYDATVSVAGGFAIFLYPPPFAIAMIPFALLPETVGLWLWEALLVASVAVAVALMPVRREVRWLLLLLAGVSWPVLYSVKLGQVGPILLLVFAVGWRSLDRPVTLGAAAALGALVKVQPGLLLGWAVVTRRWRTVAAGVGILLLAAAAATVLLGPASWFDYAALLGRVNDPITTPHNFTPGAIAYQLGADRSAAAAVQVVTLAFTALVTVAAWLRTPAATAFMVTVVASQLVSPLLWDHYAILLLLPTAFLLERRRWWAVLIPLAGWLPAPVYPVLFAISLLAPIATEPSLGARRAAPGCRVTCAPPAGRGTPMLPDQEGRGGGGPIRCMVSSGRPGTSWSSGTGRRYV